MKILQEMYSSISNRKTKPDQPHPTLPQTTIKKFQQNNALKNLLKSLTEFLFCARYTTVAQECAASISKEYCSNG